MNEPFDFREKHAAGTTAGPPSAAPSRALSLLVQRSRDGYATVGPEYYCPTRHPTCANFGALHTVILQELHALMVGRGPYLEVGCGEGRLDAVSSSADIVLTDISEEMLAHARRRTAGKVKCHVMNALAPTLTHEKFAGIAAFMADPYNIPEFYFAIRDCLAEGGFLAVSLPNHIWASAVREHLAMPSDETAFIVNGTSTVAVPSITRPIEVQAAVFKSAGLEIVRQLTASLRHVSGVIPSHHVRYAADRLRLDPLDVPLVDFFVTIQAGK